MMNTAAFSVGLSRAYGVDLAGDWDDAMVHADRALAINLESDFGFPALGDHRNRGPGARRRAGTGMFCRARYVRAMIREHDVRYERAVTAAGDGAGQDRRGAGGPHRGDLRPGPGARHSPIATGRMSRASGRGPTCTPTRWSRPAGWAEADALPDPPRAPRGRPGTADRDGPARPIAWPDRGGGRPCRMGPRGPSPPRSLHLDGLAVCPFELARVELAAGAVLRRLGPASPGGGPAGRRAAAVRRARRRAVRRTARQELAASGLDPTTQRTGTETGLTSQELVVARRAARASIRELAAELVVSVKTVEYHLRNAFAEARRDVATPAQRLASANYTPLRLAEGALSNHPVERRRAGDETHRSAAATSPRSCGRPTGRRSRSRP